MAWTIALPVPSSTSMYFQVPTVKAHLQRVHRFYLHWKSDSIFLVKNWPLLSCGSRACPVAPLLHRAFFAPVSDGRLLSASSFESLSTCGQDRALPSLCLLLPGFVDSCCISNHHVCAGVILSSLPFMTHKPPDGKQQLQRRPIMLQSKPCAVRICTSVTQAIASSSCSDS